VQIHAATAQTRRVKVFALKDLQWR